MKSKRLLSFVMCLILLLGTVGLFACNQEDDVNTDTETDAETEAPPQKIALVENGEAVYTLVYPNDATSVVVNAVNTFVEGVKKATGVTLPTKSDYLRRGQERDPEAKEILFGKTSYDETQEILSGLYSDEYVIKAVGNKIVITSTDDNYMLAAANYYVKKLIPNNLEGEEGSYTLYFEEYRFMAEGADKVLNINGKAIKNFTIIYETERDGYKAVAERLSATISTYMGITLPVVADTARKEGSCEILVGNTNRKLSGTCYGTAVDLLTYKVVINEDKMQIVSGGPYSARDCVDNMGVSFFAAGGKQLTDGTYLEKDLKASVPALTSGADVRIMTSNMLTSWWGEGADASIPPVIQRAEIAAAILVLYKPDAVGLQEVDGVWIKAIEYYGAVLKNQYGIEYSLLHATYQGKANLTAIMYRSDKLTVEASGVDVFDFWADSSPTYHMRNVTWAVFKSGTQKFMLANTHWAHESDELMTASSNEMTEFVNGMKSTYNCPIFCTGDYNAKPEEQRIQDFMSNASVQSLREQAKSAGVLANECGGCGKVGSTRLGGSYIDHIFGYGSYTVKRYETVTGNAAHWMSDHAPHCVDVKLN